MSAAIKCPRTDFPYARREDDPFEPTASEAFCSDLLEPASFLERNFLQVFASLERSLLYRPDAFRNYHALDAAPAKPVAFDILNTIWNHDLAELPQVPEKSVADHRFRRQYRRVIAYVLLDIWRAAIFHKHCSEILTAAKCVFVYFPECAGKCDLLDSVARDAANSKAFLSNVLYAIRYLYAYEVFADVERPLLKSLQRGREFNALYRTMFESTFAQYLQPVV